MLVFVGANQTKVTLDLLKTLQPMGVNADYIVASGNGRNALDFHIAFYLGDLANKDPEGLALKSVEERIDAVIKNLNSRGSARPRRLKTLSSTIHALFTPKLEQSEVDVLIAALEKSGAIVVKDGKVSYTE